MAEGDFFFLPKPIHNCDNYPCFFPLAHLHNQHQSFTVVAQRNIMKQKSNKGDFRCQHNAATSPYSFVLIVPKS